MSEVRPGCRRVYRGHRHSGDIVVVDQDRDEVLGLRRPPSARRLIHLRQQQARRHLGAPRSYKTQWRQSDLYHDPLILSVVFPLHGLQKQLKVSKFPFLPINGR